MNIYQAYSYLLLLIGIVYIVMFLYTLKPKENTLFSIFSLLCLTSAIYIFGTWFQLNASNIEQIYFGQTIKYFGLPLSSAIWLVFAFRIQLRRKMSFAGVIALFAIPVFTIMLVATNQYHHLFYNSVSTFERDGFLLSTREPGLLYPINIIFSYGVFIFVLYVFARAWIRSKHKINSPFFWLLIGGVVTFLLSAIYLLGLFPVGIDTIPLGYLVLAFVYALALFRYNLFDSKQIFDKKIFSEIKEGLIVTDESGLLIDYNKAATEVFGWLSQANKGRPISDFDHGHELMTSNDQGFCLRLAKGEQTRTYEFRITELIENKHNIGRVYIFLDVTDQVKTLKDLNYMVNHDSLTNAYNRRKILEELENRLQDSYSRGVDLSILMLDIDHFKKINDNYGHQAGDSVLSKTIKECSEILRKGDIVGRYGGEEFLVILPNTNGAQAAAVAEKLRNRISKTEHHIGINHVKVTLSIGAAAITASSPDIRELIKLADDALYEAKKSGRNRVIFAEDTEIASED